MVLVTLYDHHLMCIVNKKNKETTQQHIMPEEARKKELKKFLKKIE